MEGRDLSWHCPDRHWQDGGFRAADPELPDRQNTRRNAEAEIGPHAGSGADARTGRADRRRLQGLWPQHVKFKRRSCSLEAWAKVSQVSEPCRRCRRAGGNARPHAGPCMAQGHLKPGQGRRCVVLDEADRMLDMGFIVPVRKIVAPQSRRSARRCSSRPPCRRKSKSWRATY